MRKHRIIFVIVILVVVNLSTYCGYNRATEKARGRKELISMSQIDSILILKVPPPGDPAKYPWKRLLSFQAIDFAAYWYHATPTSSRKFQPAYNFRVYTKNQPMRKFSAFEEYIKEGKDCYVFTQDKNYFESLYQSAEGE